MHHWQEADRQLCQGRGDEGAHRCGDRSRQERGRLVEAEGKGQMECQCRNDFGIHQRSQRGYSRQHSQHEQEVQGNQRCLRGDEGSFIRIL